MIIPNNCRNVTATCCFQKLPFSLLASRCFLIEYFYESKWCKNKKKHDEMTMDTKYFQHSIIS